MESTSEATEGFHTLIRNLFGNSFPPIIQGFSDPHLFTLNAIEILDDMVFEYATRLSESNIQPRKNENIKILKEPIYDFTKTEAVCSICFEDIKETELIQLLDCTHFFHHNCLSAWVKIKDECPVCRHKIEIINIEDSQKEQ